MSVVPNPRRRRAPVCIAAFAAAAAIASVASGQFVISPLHLEGQPAPGTGFNFQNFNRGNINNAGVVSFTGDTDNPTTAADSFLYVGNTLVGLEGDAAPGGGTFGTFASFTVTHQHLNSAGNVIFENPLNGVPTTNNATLFTRVGGTLSIVAQEGAPAPGIVGRNFISFDDPGIFDDNNHGFLVDLDGTTTDDSVIYRGSTPIYREGTTSPVLPAGVVWDATFTDLTWNPQGVLLFEGNSNEATGSDQVLVRDVNGTGTIVRREGDPIAATAGADTIELFLQTALSDDGKWAFRGNLAIAPATSDAFILTETGYYKQEGDAVPELPGVVLGNFNDIDINNNGDVLFLADLEGHADPNVDEGYFYNNQLIVTAGSQVPGLPVGSIFTDFALGNAMLNENGQIVFEASYTEAGSTTIRDGLFLIEVPEPATAGLLAAAGALVGLRRRR